MPKLVITITAGDATDLDWLRHKVVPAVEREIQQAVDEDRLEGEVDDVEWEIPDE